MAATPPTDVKVSVTNRPNWFPTIILVAALAAAGWFDIDTIITCLDPKYENLYSSVNSIVGQFFGLSFKDVAGLRKFVDKGWRIVNMD